MSLRLADWLQRSRTMLARVDMRQRAAQLKTLSRGKVLLTRQQAQGFLEEHWPKIESLLVDGLLQLGITQLQDDRILTLVLGEVYELLPRPLRLLLSRERFVHFALQRRAPLLLKLQSYQQRRNVTPPPSPPQ